MYTVCYSGDTLCYMKRYGVRELRQNACMVLREVAAGETIEITSNGHPVAQLIPAVYDPWAALIASKEVTPARTGPADILTRPPRHYGPRRIHHRAAGRPVIYLDATAMIRLIAQAPESPALTAYLRAHTDTRWISCALSRAELLRATAGLPAEATEHAHHVLAGIDTVGVTDRLLDAAITLTPAPARTVDALHIAAALSAGPAPADPRHLRPRSGRRRRRAPHHHRQSREVTVIRALITAALLTGAAMHFFDADPVRRLRLQPGAQRDACGSSGRCCAGSCAWSAAAADAGAQPSRTPKPPQRRRT